MKKCFSLKKHRLTLIEVVISMSLFTVLLGVIFFWYHHLLNRKEKLENSSHHCIEEYYAWMRLDRILIASKGPYFSDSESSFVFLFDRGIAADPKLSETVLGKLFHDPLHQTLCLTLWPNPEIRETTPSETFVLLDRVVSLEFQFYASNPFEKIVDPEQVGTQGKKIPKRGWHRLWDHHFDGAPALVKLTLSREDKTKDERVGRTLLFDLNQAVFYPMESV